MSASVSEMEALSARLNQILRLGSGWMIGCGAIRTRAPGYPDRGDYKSIDQSGAAIGTKAVFLNTGTGWRFASWSFPSGDGFLIADSSSERHGVMMDVNSDGRTDYVDGSRVYLSNGHGFTYDPTGSIPDASTTSATASSTI